MKILAHISWAYATLIIFTGLTFSIIMYPIVPRPYARKIAAWFIRLSIFFSTSITGKEDPDTQMFLVNHQSDLDIGIIETITNKDITWVAKKALFEVPFFGLAMSMPEDIEVERENKTSLIKLLRAAKDRLKKKRVITMFPEGTRSRGAKMLPFKSGAKVIADQNKLKVQAIVLVETAKCYNIKRFYYVPRNIKVIFLDSFVANKDDPDWLHKLRETMQQVYNDALKEM